MPEQATTPTEEDIVQGGLEAAEMLKDALASRADARVEDWRVALDDGDRVLWVSTGKFNEEGDLVRAKVTVRDPKEPALAIAYLVSKDKKAATLELWRCVVVSPQEILEDENYAKLTGAFVTDLTYQILEMLGVNGDFFDRLERMASPKAVRRLTKSYSKSPSGLGGSPTKSEPGPAPTPPTSTPLTSTPASGTGASAANALPTTPGPRLASSAALPLLSLPPTPRSPQAGGM